MKFLFIFTFLFFITNCITSNNTFATTGIGGESIETITFSEDIGGSALTNLVDNIVEMTENIGTASAQMMKIGDMLLCNSFHGKAATWNFVVKKLELLDLTIFISGCILYIIGLFITVATSFYMFDIALNLTVAILLLPLALALWPFAWTKEHLKSIITSITYYIGLFIFLPLGILIAQTLVINIINDAFESAGSSFSFTEAFDNDESDLINDNLGISSITFIKLLIAYILAFKIIPLLANEFCGHFFGEGLLKSPMSDKLSEALKNVKEKTIGKASKYAGDVMKHQKGNFIKNKMGNENGNLLQRGIAKYGKRMSKTKKS